MNHGGHGEHGGTRNSYFPVVPVVPVVDFLIARAMNLEQQILAAVARKTYQPLKPKALARKLGLPAKEYSAFPWTLRELVKQGRLILGKNHTVRPTPPHGTVSGIYRRTSTGNGYVRPHVMDGQRGPGILIQAGD